MKKIYIVHGWTYSLDFWKPITSYFKEKDIEPIFLKVPGLTEPSDEVWDIDSYVDWLNDKLKNETKPILVGHSNGGRIAMSFVQKYPDKLSKLILIDSAGVAHTEFLPKLKLKILKVISKIGRVFTIIPGVKKLFYKLIGAQDYLNAPPNMKKTMANMLAADKNINPRNISVPTTIIWGKNDLITPLKDGQKLFSLIPESTIHIIDDARHSPFANHPEEVADIIERVVEEK